MASHRFKQLVERAGVPLLTLHYTRHNYASLALRAGETLAAVSEVLGHADRETTLRFYQEVQCDQHHAVADAVTRQFMSRPGADVRWDVTNKDDGDKSPLRNGRSGGEVGTPVATRTPNL